MVEESDDTTGVGEDELIALAVEFGDGGERLRERGWEMREGVASLEAGVESGEDELGGSEGEVGFGKSGKADRRKRSPLLR